MRIRSIDLPRTLRLPDDQTLLVSPEGIEVPEHLEGEVRAAVGLTYHLVEMSGEEWAEKQAREAAAREGKPEPEVRTDEDEGPGEVRNG